MEINAEKKLKKRKTYDASVAKALFKRRTFRVPNLKLLLSKWKVRRTNQLGSADLYSGRQYRSIRLGLSDKTVKDRHRFIRRTFHVLNLMQTLYIYILNELYFTHNSERFAYMPCAKAFEQYGGKGRKVCAHLVLKQQSIHV